MQVYLAGRAQTEKEKGYSPSSWSYVHSKVNKFVWSLLVLCNEIDNLSKTPLQTNGYDCGVFVMAKALSISFGMHWLQFIGLTMPNILGYIGLIRA